MVEKLERWESEEVGGDGEGLAGVGRLVMSDA